MGAAPQKLEVAMSPVSTDGTAAGLELVVELAVDVRVAEVRAQPIAWCRPAAVASPAPAIARPRRRYPDRSYLVGVGAALYVACVLAAAVLVALAVAARPTSAPPPPSRSHSSR